MPVVEHRIVARKIEQLRAQLVEKPLMKLDFVVCVRHAMLQTIPVKYFFHNPTEPSRPHCSRRCRHVRLGTRAKSRIRAPRGGGKRETAGCAYWRAELS
jgi:endogenous inhibitor of DNA gyrase (YacG/DUF329 family)